MHPFRNRKKKHEEMASKTFELHELPKYFFNHRKRMAKGQLFLIQTSRIIYS
jgi:hypothetical protein